ncbi:hypothetical protein HDU77_000462 [Chytriomyces hyalinus]|nr:hypothetical protein HDU77_000462 [Chytriomyces hyalinus]
MQSDYSRIFRESADHGLKQANKLEPPAKPIHVHFRPSLCGSFTVVAQSFRVPLSDSPTACIPMDRRCLLAVYERARSAKGAILLIPGFAANRQIFDFHAKDQGPSFIEYFAHCGYDVFSVDMRGTRESLSMGAKPPVSVIQHIEVDIPSAISCIQKLGHEKVFLIGHSMGAALCCAVAGKYPELVAGVVHLAGLYNFTFLVVGDMVDMAKAHCPRIVQTAISRGASVAIKSMWPILGPALNILSTALNVEPLNAPPASVVACARYSAMFVRRQVLPFRPALEALLCLGRIFPTHISNAIVNRLYPSIWHPYSFHDPIAMAQLGCENPTLGVCLSVGKRALKFLDIYSDQNHKSIAMPDIQSKSESVNSQSGTAPVPASNQYLLPGWDELGPYFDSFERLQHMPVFFIPANKDQIVRNEDSLAGYERSGSKWKESLVYHDPSISPAKQSLSNGHSHPSNTAAAVEALRASLPPLAAGTNSFLSPRDRENLKRNASGTCVQMSSLYKPARSVSRTPANADASTASQFQIEEDSEARNVSWRLLGGSRYKAPAREFGHLDILGGIHAEEIWKRIGDWLDVTSTRERDWKFLRRFSAK